MTFAARDFSPRRGESDEHIPQWICEERATKSGRKRPAALRVAPNLACGFVARRLQPQGRGCALLAPRHRPNWAQRTSSYLCLRQLTSKRVERELAVKARQRVVSHLSGFHHGRQTPPRAFAQQPVFSQLGRQFLRPECEV